MRQDLAADGGPAEDSAEPRSSTLLLVPFLALCGTLTPLDEYELARRQRIGTWSRDQSVARTALKALADHAGLQDLESAGSELRCLQLGPASTAMVRDAMVGLLARNWISQADYEVLTRAFATTVGPVGHGDLDRVAEVWGPGGHDVRAMYSAIGGLSRSDRLAIDACYDAAKPDPECRVVARQAVVAAGFTLPWPLRSYAGPYDEDPILDALLSVTARPFAIDHTAFRPHDAESLVRSWDQVMRPLNDSNAAFDRRAPGYLACPRHSLLDPRLNNTTHGPAPHLSGSLGGGSARAAAEQASSATSATVASSGQRPQTHSAEAGQSVEARNSAIVDARLSGATLEQIGEQFSLTRERVRQILVKHGGPTSGDARSARRAQLAQERHGRAERIRDAVERLGASTVQEIADALTESVDLVARSWPQDLKYLRLNPRYSAVPEWSDAQIFEALRSAASYAFPLTAQAYKALLATGEVSGPSVPRIGQRFGSWTNACERAGVESGRALRDSYQSRWTDEELIRAVRAYLVDPSAPNSFGGYGKWRSENDPDAPSAMTIRNRLGKWEDIKRMALPGGAPRG